MGSRDPQTQLWNYRVNLDKRVRTYHPLRKLNEVFPSWYPTSGTTKQLWAQTLQEWAMGKWGREADAQPLGSKFRRLFSRLISAESITRPGELHGCAAAASKSNVTTGFVLPRSV
jgi:hypothetical protein